MAEVKKELVNLLLYSLTSSISDLFGVSTPAIVRRIGNSLLKRAEERKWIPHDISDPMVALNELFSHYSECNYCDEAHAERVDNHVVIRCDKIVDYERIERLAREGRHTCMFISALAMAFLNDYFNISVVLLQTRFRLIPEERGTEEVLELVSVGG